MREQLQEVYSQNHLAFKNVRTAHPDRMLGGPLLIYPNDLYQKQPFPLLVIGQETNGWYDQVDDVQIKRQQYQTFNVGEGYRPSPFWNITRKVEAALGNQPYSCVWSNINRFDLDRKRPYGEYEATISTLDFLLVKEI